MQQTMIPNSGIMTVPQIAAPQLVYLDFDGELASYNGELLTIDRVEVEDSGLTQPQIIRIVSELNKEFEGQNIVFTAEKPASGEYSTVFIGGTSAFEPFGSFAGLAETVDTGNAVRNDNAFVILKGGESIEAIIKTIAHETQHLIGTLDHGGEGLGRYAQTYIVSSGVTSSGLRLYDSSTLIVRNGGRAVDCEVYGSGNLMIESGGSMYGGRCELPTISSGAYLSGVSIEAWVTGGTSTTFTTGSFYDCKFKNGITSPDWNLTFQPGVQLTGGVFTGNINMRFESGVSASQMQFLLGDYSFNYVYVLPGAKLDSCTVTLHPTKNHTKLYEPALYVFSGGQATNTLLSGGVAMNVSSGGYVDGTLITSGECIVNSNTKYTSAKMWVAPGGSANRTVVYSGGEVLLAGNMTSSFVNGGSARVSAGGCLDSCSIFAGAVFVSSGGRAENSVVNGGGLYVVSGGSATATKAISDLTSALVYVSGGFASGIQIDGSATELHVKAGGNVHDITATDGAWICVAAGGSASSVTFTDEVLCDVRGGRLQNGSISDGILRVSQGTVNSATISNGSMFISGGLVSNTTITGASVNIDGGTTSDCTFNSGADVYFFAGTLNTASIADGAYIKLRGDTATITKMILHSGGHLDMVLGTATGLTVSSGGAVVQSGGKMTSATILSGGEIRCQYASADGIKISGGYLGVLSNGNVSNVTGRNGIISAFGGQITSAAIGGTVSAFIGKNGIIDSMTSYLSAGMVISSGGSALNTILNSGTVYAYSSSYVQNLSMSCGLLTLYNGVTLAGTIVNGGKLVTSGYVNAIGATYTMNLAGNTLGTDVTLVDNCDNIFGVSYAVRVASDQQSGLYRLLGNASAFNQSITLNVAGVTASPGTLSVGTSLDTWSHQYALTRTGSTVALQVTMKDIPVKIYSGGVMVSGGKTIASKTISGSGVVMRISGGGVATATTVSSDGTIFISSGGGASGITARGSGTNVENRGGVMTDFSQYDGFSLIAEGGSVRNLNASGGQVAFLDATLGGMIHAAVYGAIDVSSQTTIDFSVADHTADGTALITRWNNIANGTKANYTITVKADQSAGTYILATGAGTFNQTLTVKNDTGSEFGTIALDETKRFGNSSYTLGKDGIKLTLTVEKATATRGDFDGNGISDILFQNLADSANPLGAWMNADKTQWNGALGPAPKSDWTVYGAYDFTGSGVCDIMFRSKRADTQYAVGYYEDGDVTQFRTMGWGVTAEWELADVGDFNGSGRADILWKNSSNGYLGLWMDGTDQWVALPASNLGSGQSLIGMGDVNGDGKDDILINSNGVLGYWDITGILDDTSSTPEWNAFGIHVGNEWETIGCADFDGNGKADIVLWRDSDGYVGTYMNCDVNDFRGIYPGASKDEWGLPGFGDYNGDGCDDVLVRNLASGALGYWDGADEFKWNEIGSGVDSTWAVIA